MIHTRINKFHLFRVIPLEAVVHFSSANNFCFLFYLEDSLDLRSLKMKHTPFIKRLIYIKI